MANDASFETFVREHSPSLLRTGALITGSRHAGEELLQDTLTLLYPRWDRVAGAAEPLAYVRRSLVNRFISQRRSRAARDVAVWELPDGWDGTDLGETVAAHGIDAHRLPRLGCGRTDWSNLMNTPDEFTTLVRDTLRSADAATQDDIAAADRLIANARAGRATVVTLRNRPGRPPWAAPLIAAAAVIVVALALVLSGEGEHSAPKQQPATRHSPPSSVVASSHSTPAPTAGRPTTHPSTSATAPALPKPEVAGFTTSDVSYLTARQGWALGDGRCAAGTRSNCATILRTTDAGRAWHRIGVPAGLTSTRDSASCGNNGTSTGPCVDRIVFATPTIGYVWSFRTLYSTIDGGAHWTDQAVQRVIDVIALHGQAVRLSTRAGCSSGCSHGMFAAPLGTRNWTQVVGYTPEGGGDAQLAERSGVGYLLEQLPSPSFSPASQRLYRSTDGMHWAQVTGAWPCGTKAIDTIDVAAGGALVTTCD